VFRTDIGAAEFLRFLVGEQERALASRRQADLLNLLSSSAGTVFLIQLCSDRIRVAIDLLEHVPHDVMLQRGMKEVLAIDLGVAPFCRGPGSVVDDIVRRFAEELGNVHLFHLAALGPRRRACAPPWIIEKTAE
jgi:hypothetical protein